MDHPRMRMQHLAEFIRLGLIRIRSDPIRSAETPTAGTPMGYAALHLHSVFSTRFNGMVCLSTSIFGFSPGGAVERFSGLSDYQHIMVLAVDPTTT